MSSISEATTKFCLDFFKVLNEDRPSGNIIYSPLSISAALGMVLLGARGNTAAQIQKALHVLEFAEHENPGTGGSSETTRSDDNSESSRRLPLHSRLLVPDDQCDIPGGIHSQFHDIFSAINKPTAFYELAIANRLYGEKTFSFLQQYLSCIQKLYQAELERADFQNAAEETREQINLWVETFTNGKIKDVFAQGTLSAQAILVLVNAVYFKGKWEMELKEKNTKERPFQINETTSKPVQMMYQKGKYKIAAVEEHDCQVLELPYKGGDLSMYILLPKDYTDLTQLEKELTYEKLTTWISPYYMKEDEVEVSLPQFKIETEAQLNQHLKALGITDVFSHESDLSGIAEAADLSVSEAVHKAYIEVNEEGTEAAAATGIGIGVTSVIRRIEFVADHPFLFFIRHQKTECILFFGRFSSPQENF
ncbi:leukocyte elastase inhibitor-like [Chelonoidis abingdonii]|uniref:leukocyte elastase inhibitor-like n=1 Tax=Chelonoidis abingdonii TaxID=106734 RepID=UPI0013F1C15F|nr:leukocyte elastase inhibitor-like [Chelonoidis abingdonii]